MEYKHIPLENILAQAPKYYAVISVIEKINVMLSKNNDWLIKFVEKNNIKFDYDSYTIWKSGKQQSGYKYGDTQCPSKWVHVLQDFFIELLEYLQILIVMECYINEEDYKLYLQNNPKIFFKVKAKEHRYCY